MKYLTKPTFRLHHSRHAGCITRHNMLANIFQRNNDKPMMCIYSAGGQAWNQWAACLYICIREWTIISAARWGGRINKQSNLAAKQFTFETMVCGSLPLYLPQWARLSHLTPFTSSCFSRLLHECVLMAHPPTGGCLINNQQAAARPPHLAAFVCQGAARSVFCYPPCREAAD
jgi:hypothetical protein